MSTQGYAELLVRLKTERDVLERRLANWRSKEMRAYGRTIEQKVRLDQEIERISLLSQKGNAGTTVAHSHEKTEPKLQQAPARLQAKQVGSKQSEPEVAKRRVFVKNNRSASASELCHLFDREGVQLPAKWEDAGFDSWSVAYKHAAYRKRIDVLISKDRKA